MTEEIRIYVEGGGDSKTNKQNLRSGLDSFLSEVKQQARQRRIKWRVVACGPRQDAYEAYLNSIRYRPDAVSILLVDSEGPVKKPPRKHLKQTDGWKRFRPAATCHLMVQVMEAWLIADGEALGNFYGHRFHSSALPDRKNVESIPKDAVFSALKQATRNTGKGTYHKTRHGPRLLGAIDPATVRSRAPHCERFFKALRAYVST